MVRRRGLTPEERELWARIARSAEPLSSRPKPLFADPEAEPTPQVRRAVVPAHPPQMPRHPNFRIGQAAPHSPPINNHAPSPAEHMSTAPLRMDQKTHRKMTQGKLQPESRLDLHGMTLARAHPALIRFLLSCHAEGLRLVLVITGKGRGDHGPLPTRPGALRHQVPHWLHQPPLAGVVQQVRPAHFRHGGEGAYYVYLRK